MKYTLAQLKKDAKANILTGELIVRCGEKCTAENLPERLQGKRKIVDSNSVAIFFLNSDGRKSEMRVSKASLVEYTGDMLTTYYPGYREPNVQEQKLLDEWKAITDTEEYQEQLQTDCYTDGSTCFYREKAFFSKNNADYLRGFDEQRGCKLDWNRRAKGHKDYIRDSSIRGEIEMQYRIERV